MKIAILTLPLRTNYGGILQAYALQTVLERQGHDVVVLSLPQTYQLSFLKKSLVYPKRLIRKYLLGKKCVVTWEQCMNRRTTVSMQFTKQFIDKYVHQKMVGSFYELKEDDYDAIVVGSDQIWRPLYYPHIDNAFLDFAKGWKIKRVAYAPSFGVDTWEYTDEQTCRCKHLLSFFDAVSTREESGVILCREHLDHDAEWVLDPTMLLDATDYVRLFQFAETPTSNGNLLCYILDRTSMAEAVIDKISKSRGLVAFRVNSQVENNDADLKDSIQPPVENWIRGFYDAQFVITDSFHACVFSILFRKQFVVVGNVGRGLSRIESLLKIFGLENRLVHEIADVNALKVIDYDAVYDKLEVRRKQSIAFLQNGLKAKNL